MSGTTDEPAPTPAEDDWGAALAEAGTPQDAPAEDDWGAALAEAGDGAEADAAAAAAAAAILAAAATQAPVEPTRVLNQAEIDSLLGFGDGGGGDDRGGSGMERVIARGLVSYERLPMLDVVFDQLVRILSTSLRHFTSDNVEVSIDDVTSLRFGDYLNSIPLPAMLAVFKAEEWENYGLIVVDSSLIYAVVDVLLGGRRGTSTMRIEGRPYTTIERRLVEKLICVVLDNMTEAFAPIAPVTFRFERLEVNPSFAMISRASNAAVVAKLRIDMESRGGEMQLLLPHATLEPVRESLLQQFMGEKFGRDSIWETHLAEELRQTGVALDVVLDEQTMSLADVLRLRVGDQIMLGVSPGSPVRLRCGDTSLFEGQVGRRNDRLAVRIERALPRAEQGRGPMAEEMA